MKHVIIALVLAVVGCKKKNNSAPPPPGSGATAPAGSAAPETKPPETPAAKPAPFEASGIAECDAVLETYKKFQACAKIKDAGC